MKTKIKYLCVNCGETPAPCVTSMGRLCEDCAGRIQQQKAAEKAIRDIRRCQNENGKDRDGCAMIIAYGLAMIVCIIVVFVMAAGVKYIWQSIF
jgi:hypothetical protein